MVIGHLTSTRPYNLFAPFIIFCNINDCVVSSKPLLFKIVPVCSQLRNKGHVNVAYIVDSLLVSNTFSECEKNISDTTYLLDYLGFTIHPDKTVLKPTQIITFLVFIIDSRNMCVRLTEERGK